MNDAGNVAMQQKLWFDPKKEYRTCLDPMDVYCYRAPCELWYLFYSTVQS